MREKIVILRFENATKNTYKYYKKQVLWEEKQMLTPTDFYKDESKEEKILQSNYWW